MMISGQKKQISAQKSSPQQKPVKQEPQKTVAAKKTTTTTNPKKDTKKQTKKPDEPKIEKEENKFEEQKVEQKIEIKVEEKVLQVKESKYIQEPKPEPIIGESVIKYSHYKDKFQHTDGYCFSAVFHGNYQLKLRIDGQKDTYLERDINKKCFKGLEVGKVYFVEVVEDAEAEAQIEHVGYKASENQECPLKKKNQNRIDNLTNELKGLSLEELKEKGDKYKDLIEARDLEECLYN